VTGADGVEGAVDAAFRSEWGRVVATLIRVTGDWDLAEECAQDAFARALERWPRDGVPRNPAAWADHHGTQSRHRAPAPKRYRPSAERTDLVIPMAKLITVTQVRIPSEDPSQGDEGT
jgi:predicted RNA polymerase sigma factor